MNLRKLLYMLLLVGGLLMTVVGADAQTDRMLIRQGNKEFRAKRWAAAETSYRKAIAKNGDNSHAVYNLGCALVMQQKDSLAMEQFAKSAQMEHNKLRRSMSTHNMGVIMQNHREYAKAIELYKQSLRDNPSDNATRYNLALCKKLLKNQPQQNKQNDKNKNKDKDKNKGEDKKQKQNQNKQQNNKDKQQQDKQQEKQNNNTQDKMSRDNAEQLLNAAVQQEKATKQRLQKAMSQPRSHQYEKNW